MLWLVATTPLSAQAWITAPATLMPERHLASVAYDPAAARAVVFSGNTLLADTWSLQDGQWTELTGPIAPPPRSSGAMAYDPVTGGLLLFGGSASGTDSLLLGDTWLLLGNTWQPLSPTNAPTARWAHAMVYDQAAGRVVLYGGRDVSGLAVDDTWVWNGSDWAQLPTSGPPARCCHDLAYDFATGRVVLFGGWITGTNLDDTWELTGSTWTQAQPSTVPSPRWGARLTFDLNVGQLLMHGGYPINDETWAWDGSDWTLLGTGGAPVHNHALFFDFVTLTSTVVTGYPSSTTQQWHFGTPVQASTAAFGTGCSGPSGTPVLSQSAGAPRLGDTVQFALTPTPFVGLFALGWSNTNSALGPLPLPLPLASFGMPGCELLVDPLALIAGTTGGASTSLAVAVPYQLTLRSQTLYLQGLSLDPNANPAWLTVSNGLGATIGWQ